MALTKRAIEQMKFEGKPSARDVRWDDEITGFGIRIYPSERKAFVISYRLHGQKHLLTLGEYGVLTLEQARKEASLKLALVIQGVDPIEQRRAGQAGITFRALADTYMESHSKPTKLSWRDDKRRLDNCCIPWGSRQVKAIKPIDVLKLHQAIGKCAPVEANRTLTLLQGMFNIAKTWRVVPRDFDNPAIGHKRFGEKARDRFITAEELPRLAEAIQNEPNVSARLAVWLYLLTGLRKNEVLNAKWSDVDLVRREIKVTDTKNGEDLYLPLSSPALALLEIAPRHAGNPFILPGQKRGRPLVNISKPWNRIREASGVHDVRIHDLRRTVGSWMAQRGNSLHLIGRVLNHKSTNTTKIYARFGQDQVRAALEDHGQTLMAIAGQVSHGDVINIKSRAK